MSQTKKERNLRRRISNALQRHENEYVYLTEERNERNTKSASIRYNFTTQTYRVECRKADDKSMRWPVVCDVTYATLDHALENVMKFVAR